MATLYWKGGTGENGNNWNIATNWLMGTYVNNTMVLSPATRSPIGDDSVNYMENIGSVYPTIISAGVFGVTSAPSIMNTGLTGAHFAILSVCATGGMILHGTTYYWAGWTGNTAGTTASAGSTLGRSPCYLNISWGSDYAGSTYLNNNTLLAMGISRIPPVDSSGYAQHFSFSTRNPIRVSSAQIVGHNNPFNYFNRNTGEYASAGYTATLATIDRMSFIRILSPTQKTKTTSGTTASYPSVYMYMSDHGATALPSGFCADWKKFAHGAQQAEVQLIGGYSWITIPSWNGATNPTTTWNGTLSITGITTGGDELNDPNIGAIVENTISLGGNPWDFSIQRGSTLGGGIEIFPQIEGYNKSINTSYNIQCSCGITSNRNAGVSFSNILGLCGGGGINMLTYKRSVGETLSYQYYISIADTNSFNTPQFGTPYYNIQEIDVANTYEPGRVPQLTIAHDAFINDIVLEDSILTMQYGSVQYADIVIKKGEIRGFSSIDMRTRDTVGSTYAALVGGGYTGSVGILNVSPYAKFTPNQNTTTTF